MLYGIRTPNKFEKDDVEYTKAEVIDFFGGYMPSHITVDTITGHGMTLKAAIAYKP